MVNTINTEIRMVVNFPIRSLYDHSPSSVDSLSFKANFMLLDLRNW